MAKMGKPLKRMRALGEYDKRLTLLIKPNSFEYKFEPELWVGGDVRGAIKILRQAYRLYKRDMAKKMEVKNDGEQRT